MSSRARRNRTTRAITALIIMLGLGLWLLILALPSIATDDEGYGEETTPEVSVPEVSIPEVSVPETTQQEPNPCDDPLYAGEHPQECGPGNHTDAGICHSGNGKNYSYVPAENTPGHEGHPFDKPAPNGPEDCEDDEETTVIPPETTEETTIIPPETTEETTVVPPETTGEETTTPPETTGEETTTPEETTGEETTTPEETTGEETTDGEPTIPDGCPGGPDCPEPPVIVINPPRGPDVNITIVDCDENNRCVCVVDRTGERFTVPVTPSHPRFVEVVRNAYAATLPKAQRAAIVEEAGAGYLPDTGGGPWILLPAAALLLGSGILTYVVLRRR